MSITYLILTLLFANIMIRTHYSFREPNSPMLKLKSAVIWFSLGAAIFSGIKFGIEALDVLPTELAICEFVVYIIGMIITLETSGPKKQTTH